MSPPGNRGPGKPAAPQRPPTIAMKPPTLPAHASTLKTSAAKTSAVSASATGEIPAAHGLCVLTIGHGERAEFRDLKLHLLSLVPEGLSGSWPEIAGFLADQTVHAADIVIVWQSQPDEYSDREILALLTRVPLATVLCISGPWCEAAGRTRTHWPPALRVPDWQAARRLELELLPRRQVAGSAVSVLPWTASREEVWLRDIRAHLQPDLNGLRCHVISADAVLRQTVVDQLVRWQATVTQSTEIETATEPYPACLVVDLEPWTSGWRESLISLLTDSAEVPVIGMAGWITPDLHAEWQALGTAAVVPKLDLLALGSVLMNLELDS